ncbi:MAG: ion transporter [Kiritimatiellae bacterium]|nr:ion transporter [Kiritimatiellia bacterium]
MSVVFAATFDLPKEVQGAFVWIERVASVVFTVEYLLRIWTADLKYPGVSQFRARLRYVSSGMAVIDLLAILPFWLPMFLPGSLLGIRAIRLIRLLRILKLNRYSEAMAGLGEVIKEKQREIFGSFFFVGLLMLVSSLIIYAAEHDAQPNAFKNAFSGLWWTVATLTTVGYGDIYPITVIGRIFGAALALLGVAAVAVPTGIISSGLIERVSSRKASEQKISYCPHCGKRICG